MDQSAHAWWNFGYAGIFACVFVEQIGAPIPAFPALLAAGALAAAGQLNLAACLAVAVAAALLADAIWYRVGWTKGGKVLNLMCKLSWRPDTCVSKTRTFFSRYGTKTLLFAKFIPGLSTLAPPLAGMSLVPFEKFLFFDGLGAAMWASLPLLAGVYLNESLKALRMRAESFEAYIPWVCGVLIIAVVTWHFVNRVRYLRELRKVLVSGIGAEELQPLLGRDGDVVVVDVRDELSVKENPAAVPTARWIPYNSLEERMGELPLEKQIVVYCDCPRDESAGEAAEMLRHNGAKQARALLGGLDGWIEKGFATEELNLEPKNERFHGLPRC